MKKGTYLQKHSEIFDLFTERFYLLENSDISRRKKKNFFLYYKYLMIKYN